MTEINDIINQFKRVLIEQHIARQIAEEKFITEQRRLQAIRDNTFPLDSIVYPGTVDHPTRAYAAKILIKKSIPVEEESEPVDNNYCLKALNGLLVPHTIGSVGFTTAEYFRGDLSIQYKRIKNLVYVIHSESWNIEDTEHPGYYDEVVGQEYIQKNWRKLLTAGFPRFVPSSNKELVRRARLCPYRVVVVNRWSIFRNNHPKALTLLNTHYLFSRRVTDTVYSNLLPLESKTQWIYRCLRGEWLNEKTYKSTPYNYLLRQPLQHLTWKNWLADNNKSPPLPSVVPLPYLLNQDNLLNNNMGDDLANKWGTDLCLMSAKESRKFKAESSELLLDEFRRIISSYFDDKFTLLRVYPDGSTANLVAVSNATNFNTSLCLFAAGSYVSADEYVMQNFSTSGFLIQGTLSMILKPDDIHDNFARHQIIALPYAIPGVLSDDELLHYEDICLKALHKKCLLLRIKGHPAKCIFLELMLAGNGATLSRNAIERLAVLANMHGFTFVVDEILTGARTGTMLLLEQQPESFRSCVSHVTLGKWLHVGIVLVSEEQSKKYAGNKEQPRTPSTFIDLKYIIPIWNKVATTLLSNAVGRRMQVLAKLKCKDDEAWGIGCLIFAPIFNNHPQNLKCRSLPLLEPIDIKLYSNIDYRSKVNKTSTNQLVMLSIMKWKDAMYSDNDQDEYSNYKHLLNYIIDNAKTECVDDRYQISNDEIYGNRNIFKEPLTRTKIGDILRKMQQANILVYVIKSKKRLRYWEISGDLHF